MNVLKRIVEIITDFLMMIIVIAIFFALYGLFQLKIQNKPYINYFGYTFFEVVSGSMSPTINTYDLIIVKVDNNVKKDDIVTFYVDNNFITHRIINYINDEKILTKGDANNANDKYISKAEIIGKVVYNIKQFGIFKRVLTNPKVIISIFATVILFTLAFSINFEKVVNDEK